MEDLKRLVKAIPSNGILIFDDLFGGWRNTKARYSFSDFLNLLDGGTSGENAHLMFFTTNHKEVLDPALLRPGRCGDTILEFGYADPHQIKSMMKSYFPETSREEIQHFIDSVKHLSITPAVLQKIFWRFRKNIQVNLSVGQEMKNEIETELAEQVASQSMVAILSPWVRRFYDEICSCLPLFLCISVPILFVPSLLAKKK